MVEIAVAFNASVGRRGALGSAIRPTTATMTPVSPAVFRYVRVHVAAARKTLIQHRRQEEGRSVSERVHSKAVGLAVVKFDSLMIHDSSHWTPGPSKFCGAVFRWESKFTLGLNAFATSDCAALVPW